MTLQRWMEKVVEKEGARITAKCQLYQERQGTVPRWVERGMGERFARAEQVEQRVQSSSAASARTVISAMRRVSRRWRRNSKTGCARCRNAGHRLMLRKPLLVRRSAPMVAAS
jgi:hypothetical protein